MLQPFEYYQTCPVCNEERFGLRNAERWRKFNYRFHKYPIVDGQCKALEKIDDDYTEDISINHLHVTCNKCNYGWVEQTAVGDTNGESA